MAGEISRISRSLSKEISVYFFFHPFQRMFQFHASNARLHGPFQTHALNASFKRRGGSQGNPVSNERSGWGCFC